jgi:acyl carrier protein
LMDRETLMTLVRQTLAEVAPEVDAMALDAARPLRRQVDLDSADWLNFLVGVHQKTGIEIPDAQAGWLATLDQVADFLVQHAV